MSKPQVALTFDDGPSAWTEPILYALKEHKARATFFVLGCHVIGHFHELKRMVMDGHEIGLHGWDHTPVDELPGDELRGQIALSKQAVEHVVGLTPRYWRSPWGRTGVDAADAIVHAGLRIVEPGIDAFDTNREVKEIHKTVLPQLKDGAVICLHDGVAPNGKEKTKSREQTVLALPGILEHCRSVTLRQLLG